MQHAGREFREWLSMHDQFTPVLVDVMAGTSKKDASVRELEWKSEFISLVTKSQRSLKLKSLKQRSNHWSPLSLSRAGVKGTRPTDCQVGPDATKLAAEGETPHTGGASLKADTSCSSHRSVSRGGKR